MPEQDKRSSVQDEFQLEVNRMRNSLNALTLKNFMFDKSAKHDDEDDFVEQKELTKPPVEVPFRRSLSKHRQDANRTHSKKIDPSDIVAALTVSQEKINDEKPKTSRVQFAEEPKPKKQLLFKDASRDSDEVANINSELPWQKKYEYRTVTPFFKSQDKIKAVSSEDIPVVVAFRPIETSRSTEDINKAILKPVAIFASKSYQELPTSKEFRSFDHFQTKSSDDLLLDNIDGIRKPESKRHKLLRNRSTSNTSLNRLSDQLVYENFYYDIPEVPMSADNVLRRKPPQPLPRVVDENTDNKRHSKTLVYVLDKQLDEFILESTKDEDEVYEEVLLRNNVDRNSDSSLFNSLIDSRDDCKLRFEF